VVLNLPGQQNYQPSQAWVLKFYSCDEKMANDFFMYVDDIGITDFSEKQGW
jgi:hypothetical protein